MYCVREHNKKLKKFLITEKVRSTQAASDKVYQLLAHMVGGSLRVLRLLPPLKLVAMT